MPKTVQTMFGLAPYQGGDQTPEQNWMSVFGKAPMTAEEAFASQGTPLGPVDPAMMAYLKNYQSPTLPANLSPEEEYAWRYANTSSADRYYKENPGAIPIQKTARNVVLQKLPSSASHITSPVSPTIQVPNQVLPQMPPDATQSPVIQPPGAIVTPPAANQAGQSPAASNNFSDLLQTILGQQGIGSSFGVPSSEQFSISNNWASMFG